MLLLGGTLTKEHAVGTAATAAGARATANAANNAQVPFRLLKPASKLAENGAFPLFYPYGDQHELFGIGLHLDAKNSTQQNSGLNVNKYKLQKLNWAENAKRRLYPDNIFLNSGPLMEIWMLRTHTNNGDMRLQSPERE